MNGDLENETWIVERGGQIVEKMTDAAHQPLTDLERLIYCLWVADYGMRNTGDLETAWYAWRFKWWMRRRLTSRRSGRVRDNVPSSNSGARTPPSRENA